jgi:hypothetical protein
VGHRGGVTRLLHACGYNQRVASRAAVIPCLAAVSAVLVAACGSSGPPSAHNPKYPYGARNDPASLSKCMRGNGVSGFPDPREGPDGGGVGFPGGLIVQPDGSMVVMGQPFAGPARKHAEQACKQYLPPGGPGPTVSAAQRAAALAAAACMRRHGLSNFPDPTFEGGHESLNLGPGLDPNSPAFQRAAAACQLQNREAAG